MCYDKTDYRIIRYPEKKNGNIRGMMEGFICEEEIER